MTDTAPLPVLTLSNYFQLVPNASPCPHGSPACTPCVEGRIAVANKLRGGMDPTELARELKHGDLRPPTHVTLPTGESSDVALDAAEAQLQVEETDEEYAERKQAATDPFIEQLKAAAAQSAAPEPGSVLAMIEDVKGDLLIQGHATLPGGVGTVEMVQDSIVITLTRQDEEGFTDVAEQITVPASAPPVTEGETYWQETIEDAAAEQAITERAHDTISWEEAKAEITAADALAALEPLTPGQVKLGTPLPTSEEEMDEGTVEGPLELPEHIAADIAGRAAQDGLTEVQVDMERWEATREARADFIEQSAEAFGLVDPAPAQAEAAEAVQVAQSQLAATCPHRMPATDFTTDPPRSASCIECMNEGPPAALSKLKAERFQQAHHLSECGRSMCHGTIQAGELIGFVEGIGWCCKTCTQPERSRRGD